MSESNRIHLIGNHDLSYMTKGYYAASGWNGAKQMFIDKVGINWNKLRHYYCVDSWWSYLCTHAGLSNAFYLSHDTKNHRPKEFLDWMLKNNKERLYDVSEYRGGMNAYGGILWCDFDEFEPIIGVRQIFGHTNDECVRMKKTDICLDTNLNHYAVYIDGDIIVKSTKGLN